MLYIFSHEYFFFLQALAGIFFLVQFLAFFFGSDTPLPGYLMVHPLVEENQHLEAKLASVKDELYTYCSCWCANPRLLGKVYRYVENAITRDIVMIQDKHVNISNVLIIITGP